MAERIAPQMTGEFVRGEKGTQSVAGKTGAVALAGVEQALARGEIAPDEHAVCLVTGSGFKDERSLMRMTGEAPTPLVERFADFAQAVRVGL